MLESCDTKPSNVGLSLIALPEKSSVVRSDFAISHVSLESSGNVARIKVDYSPRIANGDFRHCFKSVANENANRNEVLRRESP